MLVNELQCLVEVGPERRLVHVAEGDRVRDHDDGAVETPFWRAKPGIDKQGIVDLFGAGVAERIIVVDVMQDRPIEP